MNILRRILNAAEAIARGVADSLRAGRPLPVKIRVPAKVPHLSYTLRTRKRLEWMNYVCNRRY